MARFLDYHLHTKLCNHAKGEMDEYVQAALTKKLDEIGFADHLPMIYLPQSLPLEDYCMKEQELPIYIRAVQQLQTKYSQIEIKLGIEADYYVGKEDQIAKLLRSAPFDYIYGSVHVVDDWVIDDDRNRAKYQNYSTFDLYQKYFNLLIKAIESRLFDIVAHFDLPKKYGDRPTEPLTEVIGKVLDALIQQKLCIELNTSGFRKPVKEQYPSIDILHLCYENDIQVTLGSDSHRPEEVGWEIGKALQILREVGYSQIVGFTKRKKIFYEI
ncbi:MAG: histidinol-phosphatase HisJ family protein [Candidatus Helarchaeota archaeon]